MRSREDLLGFAPSGPRNADSQAREPSEPRNLPSVVGGSRAERFALVGDAYEGASRLDRSIALWQPRLNSADQDILPVKATLDARSRDILRNDAFVQNGVALHKDCIVGAAFLLNAKPSWKLLDKDETWAKEFQEEVEIKFGLYAESPNNWIDAARRNTLTSMIRLAVGVALAGGEIIATAEWIRQPDRLYSTALQLIELERLSNPYLQMDSPTLRGGIQMDRYGAPVGYHIRQAHPSEFYSNDSMNWKFVPVRKPWGRIQVIHLIEQDRIDQSRGISQLVAALKELRITKKFRDIVLQNAIVNATFAASIESEFPHRDFQAIGNEDLDSSIVDYAASYLGAVNSYSEDSKNLQIDGVRIPHLFPGTKLQLRPAGNGGPLGTEFEASLLRYTAAGIGVSYEELSRDFKNSNYASFRAAANQTWRFMQSRKKVSADTLASHAYRLWLEEAINRGEITTFKPSDAKALYTNGVQNLLFEALTSADWIGASRGQIDELKETQAAVLRLKYHLSTLEDEHAKSGKDWRRVLEQAEREQTEMKSRGLSLPTDDNTVNAISGAPREKEASDEQSNGSEDE